MGVPTPGHAPHTALHRLTFSLTSSPSWPTAHGNALGQHLLAPDEPRTTFMVCMEVNCSRSSARKLWRSLSPAQNRPTDCVEDELRVEKTLIARLGTTAKAILQRISSFSSGNSSNSCTSFCNHSSLSTFSRSPKYRTVSDAGESPLATCSFVVR
jgi:hypothetical protein